MSIVHRYSTASVRLPTLRESQKSAGPFAPSKLQEQTSLTVRPGAPEAASSHASLLVLIGKVFVTIRAPTATAQRSMSAREHLRQSNRRFGRGRAGDPRASILLPKRVLTAAPP